jgi:predicted DNA-binding protein with PD1-like motif
LFNIRIENDQEVINYIMEYCKGKNIKNAAIVSVIGAIDSCCISNMPKNNAKEDIFTEYNVPLELIGSGEVKNGEVHIHCTLGQEDNKALAGHLHWANVKTWFVSANIIPL